MKKIICLCLAALLTLSLVACNVTGNNGSSIDDSGSASQEVESSSSQEEEEEKEVVKDINAVYPSQAEYVFLSNDFITDWLNTYTHGSSGPYALQDKFEELYYPKESITLSWSDTLDCEYYAVYINTSKDTSTAKVYQVTEPALTVTDLLVGKDYYWRVVGFKNDKAATFSNFFHFSTALTPRTIYIDGVSNTRDIGGYMTSFGKQVKQGLVYRCARTENVTELGKKQVAEIYGIKTELDLRGGFPIQLDPASPAFSDAEEKVCLEHVANGSSLGASVTYKYVWTPSYVYDVVPGFTSLKYEDPVTKEHENDKQFVKIMKEFANQDNYPIMFHCAAGRDRTGTIACVLNALLGVAEEYLYIDYELSYLSIEATTDKPISATKIAEFESILSYLYTFEGETLADKTANYLMKYGMTQEEIDTIRKIMLEE